MAPDSIIVMDESRRMVGDIIETYSHGGATFAKVRTGPTDTGFVEVPDNPETPNYELYCHECGHEETQPDGSTERVGDKAHVCAHEGSAEVLQRIHALKHGHDAVVLPTAERVGA